MLINPFKPQGLILAKNCLFRANVKGKVFVYVCGITVHDLCHVGHLRMLVSFDVILSWLREIGHLLFLTRNISDFDDKILTKLPSITHLPIWVKRMEWNLGAEVLPICSILPDLQPKASAFFYCILKSIKRMVKKKAAYLTLTGNVYFIAAQSLASAHQETMFLACAHYTDKKDVRDFAVWKAGCSGERLVKASPYSLGKPGWHAECSTMCYNTFRRTIDLHGGGEDLRHPHHYNERQQNDIITNPNYIRHWVHNGLVFMGNLKMSNSINNIIRAKCLLKRFHPEVVRFSILCSHYKSSFQFCKDSFVQAERILLGFYRILPDVPLPASGTHIDWSEEKAKMFRRCMDCNFNTPEALSILISILRSSSIKHSNMNNLILGQLARVLGILNSSAKAISQRTRDHNGFVKKLYIDSKMIERCVARSAGHYHRSDKIRACLQSLGALVTDSVGWSTWL